MHGYHTVSLDVANRLNLNNDEEMVTIAEED
jgi:hypothetical protein